MKVVIIGGGAAGMIAGITAAKNNCDVTIIEKNSYLGRKVRITGKGRCNITNAINIEEFIKNIPGNGKFLYSAFKNFDNKDIVNLLKEGGLETKVERGNRVFPVTDNAESVVSALHEILNKLNVQIIFNAQAIDLDVTDGKVNGVIYTISGKKKKIGADKVIMATGGMSYPITGSTGDGYKIAQKYGHKIQELKPGLVPMECYEKELCQMLQGLSLKNVQIELIDKEKNNQIYKEFGEMLFTHFGVSGPTIISASSHLIRYKDIERLLKEGKIKLNIDLKPALDTQKLDLRIRRDFEEYKNKQLKNSLDKLLPQKMIPVIIKLSKIHPDKKINEITKKERINIINAVKCLELTISAFRPISEAIITVRRYRYKRDKSKDNGIKKDTGIIFCGRNYGC